MLIEIDIDKNSWIEKIPVDYREQVINKYLNLGYVMSTLCQQTVNPMSTLFEPIMNKVSESSNQSELTLNAINSSIRENIGSLRGTIDNFIYQHIFRNVRNLLTTAVKKRFMAEREIGCLCKRYWEGH